MTKHTLDASYIKVEKASIADKKIVSNLMQFYQYDFTDFGGEYVSDEGDFSYKYLDSYWQEKERHPFLIYAKKELAGFCLVNKYSLINSPNTHSIAEFFILRYLRGQGIGKAAASKVIDLFPGNWEISQTYQNINAQKFWLNFVNRIVGSNYEKLVLKEQEKILIKFSTNS